MSLSKARTVSIRRHTMKPSAVAPSPAARKRGVRWPIRGSGAAWFALAVMAVLLTPVAWGQDNGTITGYVNDTSEALVANAKITITNTATNQVRETVSNSSGNYRFANV